MNRRDFLSLSLLASVQAFIPLPELHADPLHSRAGRSHAAFAELTPGTITPEGWLGLYLHRQSETLAYALPDVSWPWSEPYWAGEETAPSWWPWEQVAYWVDGATRCALVNNDNKLLDRVMQRIQYTLTHANGSYLGPRYTRDGMTSYNRWPHSIFFRSLTALSDKGVLKNIPEILSSFYLSAPDGYDLPARNTVNVETMLWCYSKTGDPRMLALAEKSWLGYYTGKPHDAADINPASIAGGGPITAHGVTYAEMAKLPAILYAYTGKQEYLDVALACQKRIFDHHMLVDGIPSTTEHFRTTTAIDSHETCDITDHTWTWGYLLAITGDGIWADRIERACFNAGMGAIRKDWKGLQYFSCPNQIIASETSNHNVLKPGNYWMAYQPNPGRGTACCGANVHRLFPNYALRMWMQTPHGGLVAAMYGASKIDTRVGPTLEPITLEQKTSYPFEDQITFTLQSRKAVIFPLKLRIPAWCAAPSLQLNGHDYPLPATERGFITLHRKFSPGDVLTLHLPMQVKTTETIDNGIAYECGPLVYTHALDTQWSSNVVEKWTNAQYPAWIAKPTSSWNHGVAPQATPTLQRTALTDDPWQSPPCSLSIEAHELPDWKPAPPIDPKGGDTLTPALPTQRNQLGEKRTLRLVPYGTTELRVTVFPKLA